jgi:hypothetical protein
LQRRAVLPPTIVVVATWFTQITMTVCARLTQRAGKFAKFVDTVKTNFLER